MTEGDPQIEVTDHTEASRYEVRLDGQLAGFIDYRERPGRRSLVHAEVFPPFEGHGVGSRLAQGALDDLRARGLGLVPLCPFIVDYLARHPQDQDLVVDGHGH